MQTIELKVSGMTCGACANHVTKGLQSVAGVQNVIVDLAGAKATVTGESLDLSQLAEAVEEEGYGASEIKGAAQGEGASETQAAVIPLSA